MLERFLLTVLIMTAAFVGYQLFQYWQKQRLNGYDTASADSATLIYFHGASCAVCPTQSRFVDQVAERFTAGLQIRKIDAECDPDTAAEYGIFSLPTTMVVDPSGHVQHINYGLTHAHKLAQQLEKFV